MPPLKTTVACPNCRLPVPVVLEQLFDVTQDPDAKRRFLSGQFNLINCPNCRFQGQAASILVYHDADKELLLSFTPMGLGLPQAEQERAVGKLVNEVINKLPQEKRKGYLLNPKPAFTLQGMIDRIYEADGITKEMLDAQRAKAQLMQKLLTASDEQIKALVAENDAQIDETFFQILAASAQAAAAAGNEAAAQRMVDVQNKVLAHSRFGSQYRERQARVEAAVRELQALGDKLTPDRLMELILKAESDDQVAAYVSLARPLVDYAFFESLTRRIDRAAGDEKARLTQRRDLILRMTQDIDAAAKARLQETAALLRKLVEAPDLERALRESAPQIDETFLAVLNENIAAAQKAGRPEVVARLTAISDGIHRLIQESAPPEIKLVNELLDLPTDAEAEAALQARANEITPELVSTLNYLAENLRQNGRADMADRLEKLYGVALGQVMAANWKK